MKLRKLEFFFTRKIARVYLRLIGVSFRAHMFTGNDHKKPEFQYVYCTFAAKKEDRALQSLTRLRRALPMQTTIPHIGTFSLLFYSLSTLVDF